VGEGSSTILKQGVLLVAVEEASSVTMEVVVVCLEASFVRTLKPDHHHPHHHLLQRDWLKAFVLEVWVEESFISTVA
jgi:hypothetical protein